ncbi:hypothetical protein [Candidatus Nitrosotenuis uzonensis]|uniref:Uncharacterized protein n=1 Tax=Candidatus Nitrosotenuis uzonensis TaxID=1407055 RepID=V6ARC7_9ARCH|nr:hypothetical protein [Candidatus Nitrosotenuis uzonensis]CDI05187.1 conserved exported hypothetical protein [Candidatus Nitrosotenuis uzonensis]
MKKPHLVLFVAGGLVAAGMVISFYGSAIITQGVAITDGLVSQASPLELSRQMDPAVAKTGIYIVHTELSGVTMSVRIFDPLGNQIVSKTIDEDRTEEQFDLSSKGEYRMVLENIDSQETRALIGLSHMPDKSIVALNIFGQAAIISGFVGVGIAVIYAVKTRRKSS